MVAGGPIDARNQEIAWAQIDYTAFSQATLSPSVSPESMGNKQSRGKSKGSDGGGAAADPPAAPPAAGGSDEKYELVYFPVMRKGLGPALCMHLSGLSWDGPGSMGRNMLEEWPAVKETGVSPFGQMPLLKTPASDGGFYVSQTTAVANFIAHKVGPSFAGEGKDYAVSQMLIAEGEDLHDMLGKFVPSFKAALGEDGKSADIAVYHRYWAEVLPPHLAKLEALLDDEARFTSGAGSHRWLVGEVQLFAYLHQNALVKPDVLSSTPKLDRWYKDVLEDPKIQEALAGNSPFGKFKQYFIAPEE